MTENPEELMLTSFACRVNAAFH